MCKHYYKKKIKNVYYSFEDPDVRTYQKAKKIFKKKGIKSKLIPSKKYKDFYKSYFLNKKKLIPLVSAKIAVSKDYQTINKNNKWITNNLSRKTVHLLRYKYDCIISTSKSINIDNSLLNCRIDGLNKNKTDLFIIDLRLNLKKKLLLNNLLKKRKTYIITKKNNSKKLLIYKKLGYKIIFVNSLLYKKNIISLYKKIYKMGYSRAFVESGLTFLNYLLKNKLIHELYIFKSNKKLGKYGKNNDTPSYIKKNFPRLLITNLDGDKLLKKNFNHV